MYPVNDLLFYPMIS